ncbi:MAG TPA: MFS transporter [Candidatus Dormibacteraeota bacterium]|nr:MFS transporter [Candidatus Dormibacteraeota bacterium]
MARAATTRPGAIEGTWSLRSIGVIAFGHGASDFYSGMVPLLIFFLVIRQQHLSPFLQGIAGFAWYLTSSIVQPLFGWYSDAHGRWWFLPVGVLLTVASVGAIGFTHDYASLLALIAVGGLGSAIMHPEAGKYAAKVGSRRHGSAISIFQIGGQVGYGIGPAVAAALLTRFGGPATALAAIPGFAAVAALFWAMPRVHERSHDHTPTRTERGRASASHGNALDVTLLVGSTGLRYLTTAAFMTYLPNVLVGRGASLEGAGEVVTAFLLVSSLGLFAGGFLGDRFGHRAVSFASLALAVPALAGFFLLPAAPALASLLVGSVLLAVQNAPGVALTQALMPRNLGMALGLMNGVAFGVGSAMVALLGMQVARIGAEGTLRGVALIPFAAAACFGMVGRWRPNAPAPGQGALP